jgi:hypothetical protein
MRWVSSSISFLKPTECLGFCDAILFPPHWRACSPPSVFVSGSLSLIVRLRSLGSSRSCWYASSRRNSTSSNKVYSSWLSIYELSLKKLNLIPLSYWHEIKDIIFHYKCKSWMYTNLTSISILPSFFTTPLFPVLVIFVQTCTKPHSS